MKKGYFNIRMRDLVSGGTYLAEVEGYKVVIPGFEIYGFFAHKRHNLFDSPWRITEVSTGFAMPDYTDGVTRQEAINRVAQLLSEMGKDKFIKAMEKAKQLV